MNKYKEKSKRKLLREFNLKFDAEKSELEIGWFWAIYFLIILYPDFKEAVIGFLLLLF